MKTTDCFDDSVLKKASSLRNKGYGTYGVCIPTPPPKHTHTLPQPLVQLHYIHPHICSETKTARRFTPGSN